MIRLFQDYPEKNGSLLNSKERREAVAINLIYDFVDDDSVLSTELTRPEGVSMATIQR